MNPIPFLQRLAENNDRTWFQAHKAEYDQVRLAWIADINRLIAATTEWTNDYAHLDGRDVTFRIYRDTRFSPDKTPYKTHVGSVLTLRGRGSNMAGYYIAAGVDERCIFAGMWCPDAAALRKMRHAIVDNIEEFEEIINNPEFARIYPHWAGQQLKTIPKGWPRDHAQAPLLRLLHYGREITFEPKFFDDPAWPERAADLMRPAKPLIDFINYSLFEE